MRYLVPKNLFSFFSASTPEVFLSPEFERILPHVVPLFSGQEKVAECFVDIVVIRVLQDFARKPHDKPFHKRPRHVLDEKVVGMPAGKVNVKAQRERVWHYDLVHTQLGHANNQRLAGVRFRRDESGAIDDAFCLHGFRCLFHSLEIK